MYYLWSSFSRFHVVMFALTSLVYAVCYSLLSRSAKPTYAPLAQGGALIDGGVDLDSKGVVEYCWDMLYWTMLTQLTSGFLSEWFWLLYTVPPCVGFYYLWVKVIYPWISKPDEERVERDACGNPLQAPGQKQKQKVKYR
jgi:hypothetical protein